MNLELSLQKATLTSTPLSADFELWVTHTLKTLQPHQEHAEMTIRLVDNEEMSALNMRFRNKNGPTNVLSFPAQLPEGLDLPILGDIIICAPLVELEAQQQQKSLKLHWAHLTVHGILHLLGYDHQNDEDATVMETLEINVLNQLGYENPYEVEGENN